MERRTQAFAKRKGFAFSVAAVACRGHIDRPGFVGLQNERVGRGAPGKLYRYRIEQQRRSPPVAVEAVVGQRHLVFADLHGCGAAPLTAHSAYLEKIGEVAGEGE